MIAQHDVTRLGLELCGRTRDRKLSEWLAANGFEAGAFDGLMRDLVLDYAKRVFDSDPMVLMANLVATSVVVGWELRKQYGPASEPLNELWTPDDERGE